ncbi:PREDICTED: fumonisin B1 esterase-like [Priapulus caudatus]|uniref:Fumonisin B1 esterase-like n=1 Tax=Priapulus caudatus TaxID=37621 RepID=A0ABM1F056_PRICU|nr:PREDICTED: fumonisin B1 esterase-like [Priapulus caudatus]
MGSRTVAAPPGSSEMKRDTSFGDTLNLSFIDDSDIDEISRSPSHKSKSSFPDYYHAPNASFDSSTKSDPVIDRDPAGKGSSPTKERKKDNSKPDMEKKPTGKATTKTPEPRPILAPTEIQVDVKEPLHETPRSRVVHYFPCCAISCDQLKAVAIVLFAFVLAIIVIVVISTTTQKNTQAFEEASATVFIGCGLVTGKHEGDVLVFRGIPYAEPPVGTMRWRPPNPLHSLDSCWNGTFDGTKAAPACYQGEGTMKELSPLKGNMSEDCLTLNVWTPDLKRQKHTTALPVVVYIHGDQFIGRDEDTLEWGPNAQQTKITNMVWVSFNYRVGALGFLALDGLASNSHSYTSGNYGLMDQIAALEWVRDNIRAFGGDPESAYWLTVIDSTLEAKRQEETTRPSSSLT